MKDNKFSYEELDAHVGHNIAITKYGMRIEMECNTCREELASATTNNLQKVPQLDLFSKPEACSMDEGCEACGS